jgi:hypothetical protein
MSCCICKRKSAKKHQFVIDCIKEIFEIECLRIVYVLQKEGNILAEYKRNDINSTEAESLLEKFAIMKMQSLKLAEIQKEKCTSIHIQGKHTCSSMYNLPDENLLFFIVDWNPLTSDLTHIYETRAYMHAKIAELYSKN